MSRRVYIDGIALWASRLPGWDIARAVLRDETSAPSDAAPRPAPSVLPPTERRRAPDTVAIALDVALRATEAAGADPRLTPSVFASTHGDLAISDYMCETLASTPTQISPTKFHNSVHNAAAGYWTIATGSHAPYTALTAHRHTFGEAWLEAAAQVNCEHTRVLLVIFDIQARGPLATVTPSSGLFAAGLVLAPTQGERSRFAIDWDTQASAEGATPARHAELIGDNAAAPCLSVFEALAREHRAHVTQTLARDLALRLAIEPLT